mmetsp:Transcript_34328/g.75413  ORF Transcript_34328/g.75413 Transcript_34328/m.75413 type:complete len:209 (-) Transcript_34328:382-1008(-)
MWSLTHSLCLLGGGRASTRLLGVVVLLLERLKVLSEKSLHVGSGNHVDKLVQVLRLTITQRVCARATELLLRRRSRLAWDLQQRAQSPLSGAVELVERSHLVDDAACERLLRINELAEQKHAISAPDAGHVDEKRSQPRRRHNSNLRLAQADPVLCRVDHHALVAREREHAAARRRVAVDGRHSGETRRVEREPHLLDSCPVFCKVVF